MGYTTHSFDLVKKAIADHGIRFVIDLGAQNNYAQPKLPAPYVSEWYQAQGIDYKSIDLSGENNCLVLDLSTDLQDLPTAGMVCDFGTKEHVGCNGAFSWEAIYNCFRSIHRMALPGGIMLHENPMTGNWPGHGFQYFTLEFYMQLARAAGYIILDIHKHPAMGNTSDGWNVVCVMQKVFDVEFISLVDFKKLDLRRS